MAKTRFLSADRARQVLSYDPITGIFRWQLSASARRMAGQIAGTLSKWGYIRIRVDGYMYYAHRLAWLIQTGSFPVGHIDHRNRIKSDNRWKNLRPATCAQNRINALARARDDVKGYIYVKRRKKFVARAKRNYAHVYIGAFDTAEAAHAAYIKWTNAVYGEYVP